MGTFHGNPVGCAVALANIKAIEEKKLLKRVEEMGKYFLAGLQNLMEKHKMVGEVAGLGLVLGIEFVKDRKTKEPATEETKKIGFEALKQGVMLNRVGYFKNRFNFHPDYTISKDEIDIIINVLDRSITKVEKVR
jgi:4-aminobutyrate aminotransferase-like enzyme